MGTTPSIQQTIDLYLENIQHSRSDNTGKTYAQAFPHFLKCIERLNLSPTTPFSEVKENVVTTFAQYLHEIVAPASERLYITALVQLFEFAETENICSKNLSLVRLLARKRSHKVSVRYPVFPFSEVEIILKYMERYPDLPPGDTFEKRMERLIILRDRALILTLAHSGLRIHEACGKTGLKRGQINWKTGRAVVVGKGDKQATVRFSDVALASIDDYLKERAYIDGVNGNLASLPVFARHDKGAGKKVKAVTTKAARDIVDEWAHKILVGVDEDRVNMISPHTFRHYFVTVILKDTGNLKLAQDLARHSSITTTTRYAHLDDEELDRGYVDVFRNR